MGRCGGGEIELFITFRVCLFQLQTHAQIYPIFPIFILIFILLLIIIFGGAGGFDPLARALFEYQCARGGGVGNQLVILHDPTLPKCVLRHPTKHASWMSVWLSC